MRVEREESHMHKKFEAAETTTISTAGNAIGFAAATVVVFVKDRIIGGIMAAIAPDYISYDETLLRCRVTPINSHGRHR